MDIVLAVAIFIVTSATAYLGVRVTLHPAETAGAKRNYKIAFAALTVTAAGLITWQSILNRDEQGKLHSQLDHIQHNTETPPQVTVNVPAMPPTTVNIPPTPKPRATLMFSIDSPDMSGAAPFVNVAGTGWELSSACKNASQVVARR